MKTRPERWSAVARRWAPILAGWGLLGAIGSSQLRLAARWVERDLSWGGAVLAVMPVWLFLALLTPPVVLLTRRFPLEREGWTRAVPVHLAAGTAFALAHVAFRTLWMHGFNPFQASTASFDHLYRYRLLTGFHESFLLYFAVVAVYMAIHLYRRSRDHQVAASRTRAALADARLRALRMQLHPHFLFNVLHSAAGLVEDDPRAARHMLARLGDLLREVLRSPTGHEVSVTCEIGLLRGYLDVQRLRFGDRLQVEVEVDPRTESAALPPFALQPLVENAIRHGLAPIERGGVVRIAVQRKGRWLHLSVEDDGRGCDETGAGDGEAGVGLSNLRERLRHLYPERHAFRMSPRPGGGCRVELRIPFRPRQTA